MDNIVTDQTSEVVSQESSTPEVITSPIADNIAAIQEKEQTSTTVAAAQNEEVPVEFKPNYKVKVLDKELEIPKEFQGLMKDAATEKQVREVFEKAYGLDTVKPKFQDLKTKYTEASSQIEYFNKSLQELNGIYDSAVKSQNYLKLDDFFEKMNMDENVILNWALAKVNLNQMEPEQRKLVESQRMAERQVSELSQKYETTESQMQTQASKIRMYEFESALAKPETNSFQEQFDAAFGKQGAFKAEVKKVGQMAWHTEQIDITPQQAIDRVMGHYGNFVKQSAKSTTEDVVTDANVSPDKKVVARPQTKTIPNISGKGTSPLKTKPRSVADLIELRKQYT